ncbi:MAG: redoxin domain-containing protein [Gemmatimonadota bacterium]
MAVQPGDPAPTFELPDVPGHTIDLAERIGKRPVVLLFFPLAFSPTCTTEMCAMRDGWSVWKDLDAEVLAISVDSPFVTQRFRDEHDLPFPVLSDFNREAAREYGVLYENFYGLNDVAKRAVFLIDADGQVAYRWVSEDAGVEPDYEEVKEVIRRLDRSRRPGAN